MKRGGLAKGRALVKGRALPIVGAVAVVALACAVWFAVQASALQPEDNAALVDQSATAELCDQVSAGVKAVFSYDYGDLERTTRAAADVLTGAAVDQYRTQFAAAGKRAAAGKLIRTTTIRSIGVRTLHGDDASLLLFLDQQTITPGGGAPQSAVAQLGVTAHRADGQWKITGLDAL
ncbi:Mce-associated membrane protein [Amycolatopsis saalfeldensis]|uniref:Mce-associated membrane protein n=1 Tax=Amycolatopsis saalfeldensis TaxID=394193 RepID=A0A1H8X2S3_9PSEU|nr:hypothetical protein [Amycolatopsis saalfeldensis]SEP34222.1 Mce-associated membrane protein [Amycolatopsis saalfeldensis]